MNQAYLLSAALFLCICVVSWAVIVSGTRLAAWYRASWTASTQERFSLLFVFVDEKKLLVANVIGAVLLPAAAYATWQNAVIAAVTGAAGFFAPQLGYKWVVVQRRQQLERALPDALAQVAGAMRAGATFTVALENMVRETSGPISQEFGLVLKEQRVGKPIEEALDNLGRRLDNENVDLVVAAAQVAKDVGGNLAEIFERLSTTLREKMAMEGKIKALTSQGKLQGWVVGLLPMGMIAVLSVMEAEAVDALFASLAGWIWLGGIMLMEVVGMMMIRKIVNIDV